MTVIKPKPKSIKQLLEDKELRRGRSLLRVPYSELVIDPDFNARDIGSPQAQEHIESLLASMLAGSRIPPLLVALGTDNKLHVKDGHCRHAAYGRFLSNIDADVEVELSTGTDADHVINMLNANSGLHLTPLEQATAFKRLEGESVSPKDMAKRVGITEARVSQLLTLAKAPDEVLEMVRQGSVSADTAIKQLQRLGAEAGPALAQAVAKAGGKRVTEKDLKPKLPKREIVERMAAAVGKFWEITEFQCGPLEDLINDENEGPDAKVELVLTAAHLLELRNLADIVLPDEDVGDE